MTVWEFVPDLAPRRRLLRRARLVLLAATVAALALTVPRFGAVAALVVLAVALLLAMLVESWGRSAPDAGPQRMWVTGGALHAEGPDVYVREPSGEAFERVEAPTGAVVDLDAVAWVSVYPSITRVVDERPAPPPEFHLVVDVCEGDGSRRCIVFDRRIPFRIRGELALVDAVHDLCGDRWREPPDDRGGDSEAATGGFDDAFGELDRRRLADWRA